MSQPEFKTVEAEQAPACFGSPSCYAGDSKICHACSAMPLCGEEVKQTLIRIKNVINVDDLLQKHNIALEKERAKREAQKALTMQKDKDEKLDKPARSMPKSVERTSKVEKVTYEIDEATEALICTLPVKAQPFATQLCKSGMVARIKKDIKDGLNPLDKTGPKFLAFALNVVIEGGFTKSGLRGQFVREFGWSDNTAASHVSLVVKLFIMFEIAIETADGFEVNPELLRDTTV